MIKNDDEAGGTGVPGSVNMNYIKRNNCVVIHADGVYGGITPRGTINMAFFSERLAIPRTTQQTASETGNLTGENPIESRDGVIRELEANVVVDLNTAISYHRWLGEKIENVKQQFNIPDEDWAKIKGETND